MSAVLPLSKAPSLVQQAHWTDRIAHAVLLLVTVALFVFLALPLFLILVKALQAPDGSFIGLANFVSYLASPSLLQSLWHSVWVSLLVTVITVPLAFVFAYAMTRSCMPFKGLFRTITLVPLLAPSLLSAISLIYWFGNQGAGARVPAGVRLRQHLRRARGRHRRVLRGLSACADDPDHCPVARRCAPLRSRRRRLAPRPGAASSRSRCRARSTA